MNSIIIVFSGAGLSAESGIPTFRDSSGLWHNHRVSDVATPMGWQKDKELVLNFYIERYNNIISASPNSGHRAIASLEERYRVINITQNIDDLLERAGCKEVHHLHGSILSKKCEKCDYKAAGVARSGEKCVLCSGQLRPDVVWFGESVDMDFISKLSADIIIGIGTSATVQPAAGILHMFSNCKKYFIDPNPPLLKDWEIIKGKASEEMPKLAKRLL